MRWFPFSPLLGRTSPPAINETHDPETGDSERVGLAFVIKLPWEAARARGNAFASGNIPGRLAWLWNYC